jgi:hypothetical protein
VDYGVFIAKNIHVEEDNSIEESKFYAYYIMPKNEISLQDFLLYNKKGLKPT